LAGHGLRRWGVLTCSSEPPGPLPVRSLRTWRMALAILCALSVVGWIAFVQHAVA
jgi:hypothetical protein